MLNGASYLKNKPNGTDPVFKLFIDYTSNSDMLRRTFGSLSKQVSCKMVTKGYRRVIFALKRKQRNTRLMSCSLKFFLWLQLLVGEVFMSFIIIKTKWAKI